MANEQNLINLADRPPEERSEIAKAGGVASGEARRRKRAMKEDLDALLALPVVSKGTKAQLKSLGIEGEDQTNQMQMLVAVYKAACEGDLAAVAFIRDTIGEKPTDRAVVETTVNADKLDSIMRQLGGG